MAKGSGGGGASPATSPPSSPAKSSNGGQARSPSAFGADPKRRPPQPLPPSTVAKICRDLLEALVALRALGLPAPHLHCGNVFVDTAAGDDAPSAAISEFELALLVRAAAPLPPTVHDCSRRGMRLGLSLGLSLRIDVCACMTGLRSFQP